MAGAPSFEECFEGPQNLENNAIFPNKIDFVKNIIKTFLRSLSPAHFRSMINLKLHDFSFKGPHVSKVAWASLFSESPCWSHNSNNIACCIDHCFGSVLILGKVFWKKNTTKTKPIEEAKWIDPLRMGKQMISDEYLHKSSKNALNKFLIFNAFLIKKTTLYATVVRPASVVRILNNFWTLACTELYDNLLGRSWQVKVCNAKEHAEIWSGEEIAGQTLATSIISKFSLKN
jgi:hypothetical protein